MRKNLSQDNVATMVVKLDGTKIKLQHLRCQKNRPINVLTNSSDTTRRSLQQVRTHLSSEIRNKLHK